MENIIQQATNKSDAKIERIIDRVLRQVFGEEATLLIYRHLESNYSLKKEEVADRIEIFAAGLEDFLRSGAYVIEQKILEDIYSSYGLLRRIELERERDEFDFVSQIKSLRKT
ncbi:hypothetical protein MUO83_01075 [Candidatus Bathyarchaeota archaeon]|jgi:hypothetical protein|nr:hypothetical protein [Candidatus Bathyarchaeota archaeon]